MEYKHINFFKGFFTHAEDWQQAESYHIEKHKLHNRCFHTPGIVIGYLSDFAVDASESGISVSVLPGYAIDAEGRDIYLHEPVSLTIQPGDYTLPTTVYIVAGYGEEKVDRRENVTNPEYSGYAFIREYAEVKLTTELPNGKDAIELARIKLGGEVSKIADADDPTDPKENQIDRRYIHIAGAARARARLEDIASIVKQGEISVAASKETMPSEKDTNVLIDKVAAAEAQHFYVANVYPETDARVSWRIETSLEGGEIEFRLYFKNFSQKATKVHYRVLKIG